MIYLIIAGTIVLITGVFMFFFTNHRDNPLAILDQVVFVLNEVLKPYRILTGIVLMTIGCWMLIL
ncbi:MAG: hypothetical protein ABIA67_05005 [Candidatus Margulisiibacteriota bacterium]